MTGGALIEARGLERRFTLAKPLFGPARVVRAVDGVSFAVDRGETFAIVGESGCGKSTLARLLIRLIEPSAGAVLFEGRDMAGHSGAALRALRREIQFIFQDPFSSLNPRMSVGALVEEPLRAHGIGADAAARRARVAELLARVGLRPEHADRYPHEFSGGQRQRIGIARALASGPKLLIGDEPVSALDVSIQAQVVNLLEDLKAEFGLTLVVIAHDLAVIRHMSDRVGVMYLGEMVEIAPTDALYETPRHPYTQALMAAIPAPDPAARRARAQLSGDMPSPASPPPGCRFHTRCPHARPLCAQTRPQLEDIGDGRRVACHFHAEIGAPVPRPPAPARSADAARRFELYRALRERQEAPASRPQTRRPTGTTSPTEERDHA
jgi:peptide/nickel transport system ATP-binding protein